MERQRPSAAPSPADASPPGEDAGTEGADVLRRVLRVSGVLPDDGSGDQLSRCHVEPLGGGADALTYLVRCPDPHVVVKLSDHGLQGEARALRAWKANTTWVPDVLGVGTVLSSAGREVQYLVLGALVTDDGDVVETARDHLDRSPSAARDLGRALGAELEKMHRTRSGTAFGSLADSAGPTRTYATWSSYLEDFFMQHADHVAGLGVPRRRIDTVCAVIRGCRYVDEPRYLHGDVSIRNIAMRGYDPLRISLFDPNPLSGDPSWDIAPLTNNVEFNERRRHRSDEDPSTTLSRDREVVAGFWESYPPVVAEASLLTAQLVQAVLQAEHRQDALDQGTTDEQDVEATHEFIRDVIDELSA